MKCGYYERRNDGIRVEKQPYCEVTKSYYGGCEGRLEECSLPTWTKTKSYVAERFVADMRKVFAEQKITRENEAQILGEFGSFFGNEQALRKYVEEHDNIQILAPMDEMLHDLVKEQRMDFGKYAQTVLSMDKLMNEWMPVFARFEGRPKP